MLFTTSPPLDITPPTVVELNPNTGANDVATSTQANVIFSEAMDVSTIDSTTVRLMDGATPVAASVSYNASTKTGYAPRERGTSQLADLLDLSHGRHGGVKDQAGNPLATNLTSSFTTAAATPTTFSLFHNTGSPAVTDNGDSQPIEVGMKIRGCRLRYRHPLL